MVLALKKSKLLHAFSSRKGLREKSEANSYRIHIDYSSPELYFQITYSEELIQMDNWTYYLQDSRSP